MGYISYCWQQRGKDFGGNWYPQVYLLVEYSGILHGQSRQAASCSMVQLSLFGVVRHLLGVCKIAFKAVASPFKTAANIGSSSLHGNVENVYNTMFP